MSIPVKETGKCSTIFQTISESAHDFAKWIGKSVQSFGSTVANYAQKTATYVKSHFSKFKDFVRHVAEAVTPGIAGGIAGLMIIRAI